MTPAPILVAVPADLRRFENYVWHGAPSTYLSALVTAAHAVPVIVPAMTDGFDVRAVLSRVDGLLVTGSATNVHPARYGAEPTPDHEPYDPDRDALTEALIRAAIAMGLPTLCICRGHQELNVALGGTLATEIQDLDGRMDHRAETLPTQEERFRLRHSVAVEPGGRLEAIVGAGAIEVNSLHRQAIDQLAVGLAVEARAPDGTVEAVSVKDARAFALGVQWHPEYWATSDAASAAIFGAFEAACRAYAAGRA
ncbi:gamma-glutamyl-gamma-aminobutyrate hydrolase family protein [Aurantimonas sp. Leaf443]|uniref:gamma-glutamyl-gamma-aminobutyrate hydrolase family protein n=1 Tax=Aurantimonas sp. Leaf443 TaxID=1736378 RepID=UPI0006F5CA53|nr:gamma-glutamyl-gamma-aminobutyrate hydrolase family protein [Aurantimonas sp. Leaf443]KQT85933.1 glutamine amidotransferase [Aurantimonas sp. Leaf443]